MDVYEMLELCNNASDIRVRVFDCESETIIFDSDNLNEDEDVMMAAYFPEIGFCEVGSYDLYLHNGVINLELNI